MELKHLLYTMVLPGLLGLGAMAFIVLPFARDGHELTWPRLLAGRAAMGIIQIGGGYIATPAPDHDATVPPPEASRRGAPSFVPYARVFFACRARTVGRHTGHRGFPPDPYRCVGCLQPAQGPM
jgi:hypothetical protein